MEDMPIWFKAGVYGIVGLTAVYTLWGVVQMMLLP